MDQVSLKLAHSLAVLKQHQDSGAVALRSKMFERSDPERLSKHGFIKEVMRGWYIASNSNERKGDSTTWYRSFWVFVLII
ncbi:hypothetical protein [Marinicellulosiphila megalodicopiae]|uniref:hypothetical protein n=1 Tax=Marinicellulosiphila megalodicopiae TaxID=2724896 RepID=UPI003BAFCFC0